MKIFAFTFCMLLVCSWAQCAEDQYFVCTGESGIANGQSIMHWTQRVITSSKSDISVTMKISGNVITIEGDQFIVGRYMVCDDSDQIMCFAFSNNKYGCCYSDELGDSGMINKVSGLMKYHIRDALYVLKCKKENKLIK